MNASTGAINLASLCSDPEKCLCWLIILLDIFSIFYLVFASFYRVTKIVRVIGWIWLGALLTADVAIIVIHTCILTLLCFLFTIMIMVAMLSVVLPKCEKKPIEKYGGKCIFVLTGLSALLLHGICRIASRRWDDDYH